MRRYRAGIVALLATVVLVGALYLIVTRYGQTRSAIAASGSTANPPTPPRPTAPPTVFPAKGKAFLGVETEKGPYDFGSLDAFTKATGVTPSVMQFTQDWAHNRFDATLFNRIEARHMLPMVSWDPWNYAVTGAAFDQGDQPKYRLANIIDGRFDAYITAWAKGIRKLGYPIAMRWGHEMNGYWYPWCEQSNGNRPGQYVRAYRHIYDIFKKVGATNVIWVWSPNVYYTGSTPLKRLYPGDAYVNWIGLSGYYGTAGLRHYETFNAIFDNTFNMLHEFTHKPIVITETGATDASGLRTRWIEQMFAELPTHPFVIGVIWFEAYAVIDWKLTSTPASARAFGAGAARSRYQTHWSIDTIPRESVPAPAPPVASGTG